MSRLAASFEYLDRTLMDDLEATLASLFRVSCSSAASIVVEIGADFGNLLYYVASINSCSGCMKSVRQETGIG